MATKKRNTTGMQPFVVSYRGSDVYGGKNWSMNAAIAFVCLLWNNRRHDEITNPKPFCDLIGPLDPSMLSCRPSSYTEIGNLKEKYKKDKGSAFEFSEEPPDMPQVPIEVYMLDPLAHKKGRHIYI